MKHLLLVILILASSRVQAFQSIYLVRHAEKQDSSRDPALSINGKKRAMDLAWHLRDANIQAIFTSEFQRTQRTAAPLAELLNLKPQVIDGKDLSKLITTLKADKSSATALVVGHSNTVPELLKGLGVTLLVELAEDEFDKLIVIALPKQGEPIVNVLRY